MSQKVRLFTLAAEFGIENDQMVARVQNLGFAIRNYMSALDTDDAQRVRRLIQKEHEEDTVEEKIRPTVVRRRSKTGAPIKPARVRPPVVAKTEAEEPVKVASRKSAATKVAPAPAPVVVPEPVVQEVPEVVIAKDPEVSAPVEPVITLEEFEESQAPAPAPSDEVKAEIGPAAAIPTVAKREFVDLTRPGLRPSSQAPIVRRRIAEGSVDPGQPGAADGKKAKGPRRRQVESREFAPQQRRFSGTGAGGKSRPMGPGRKRRMTPGKKGKQTEITTPKAIKRVIKIEGQITLQELAKRMSVKATELLMNLIGMGMAGININSTLDLDTAKIVSEEFGYEVSDVTIEEDDLLAETRAVESDEEKGLRTGRAPIVTMMGHVDHGKTSLLDAIRKSNVVDGEAGGITQHIGAYRVKTSIGELAFIDTPGHAAFTAMRARGAQVTDIVVLVCAADDGVMPQTIEAIDHARAAGCPIIVAVNKCDMPAADPERARRMLMEHNLIDENLGGDTIIVEVSAKTGDGIPQLLEMISLQSELMELDANPNRPAHGYVLEAYLDRGRGPVANVLVKEGTLTPGDIVVAGSAFGKLRALTDENGKKVKTAGPSNPVEILGLSTVPLAGDMFDVVGDVKLAEKVAGSRAEKVKASASLPTTRPSLEAFYEQMQGNQQAELKLIVKSDVQGTMEALKDALVKLTGDKVKVNVVHASCGGITESDVLLASTADAIIIGFNVRPAGKARKLAEEQGIDIKIFSIIYEVVDAVKAAMVGLLAPIIEEVALGMAEVRDTFTIPKIGTIAGSYVTEGKILRNALARLIRDSVQIWEGKLSSLRRFKDDAKEVASGFECGICLEGYNDIKVGDVIEAYQEKEVQATLE